MDGLDLPLWWQKFDHESSLHSLWPSEAAERAAKARFFGISRVIFCDIATYNKKTPKEQERHSV